FDSELALQKERSRSSTAIAAGDWVVLAEDDRQEFVGYTRTEADVKIVKYREVSAKGRKQIHLVFNLSPFYAESGGQVGDTGVLVSETEEIKILDTRKEHGLNIHFADKLPDNPHASFKAKVDLQRRKDIMANHSATHLLHAALRTVLGNHVEQKGSLVAPDYLRFDFSHYSRVEAEDLKTIENIVNARILENIQSSIQEMPVNEAMQLGAMALFGEKYGDVVRVVTFDPKYSIELCGGTHVPATGSIGYFKIISESAVAAGVRRIEAVTGNASSEYIRSEIDTVNTIRQMLRTGKDPVSGVSALQDENSQLRKKIEQLMKEKAVAEKQRLVNQIKSGTSGLSYLISKVELDNPDLVKTICFELKQQFPNLIMLLAHLNNEKPMLAAAAGDQAVQAGFNAVSLIREVSSHIQGGGGGQPFFATAGGKNIEGIDAALNAGLTILNRIVEV
ncbi:MAG: alanine--tRNA ligase, partial [Bacteroidetes bacterium]|nr:alanine--tRNA ligase [Bacteroidota bacterium]